MFARMQRSRRLEQRGTRSIAAAVRDRAGHEIWTAKALEKLQGVPGVDRCGVWLAAPDGEDASSGDAVFRGEVRESLERTASGEWEILSLEPPLPAEALRAGRTVEFTRSEDSSGPVAGPAMGMRCGLWVPVMARGSLQGVVLLAAQAGDSPLPAETAVHLAAELGLALEWEFANALAEERKADLELNARVHFELSSGAVIQGVLQGITESCTGSRRTQGAGAVFALIGARRTGRPVRAPSAAREEEHLEVLALSGDSAWAHSVEQGPLEMFWRRAVESGQMIGAEASALPLAREIARIVALPLFDEGAARGVLLAGLPRRRANLETIERLERRALLAAQVLRQQARLQERADLDAWQHALLGVSERPVVLLDERGFLRGLSQGAAKLLGSDPSVAGIQWDKPELRFVEQLRPKEWERANQWLSCGPGAESGNEILRVQLRDGSQVHCRHMAAARGGFRAIALEMAADSATERSKQEVEAELRQTVGWMEEGVVLFDQAGGVRAANERFYRMMGLATDEIGEARTFEELLRLAAPHAREPEQFAMSWRALADSPSGETQEELQMSWPVPQALERCTREIVGENGRRLGRVEVYREMTARRMFQSRMAQTEKLASLGQRVSGIVHDLSNPLTTILGYAQRLLPRVAQADGNLQQEIRGILGEAERATGILRQMLRLSGESRGLRERLSLNELVDRTVDLMRAALSGSPVRLVLEKEPSLPPLEGDFGQLQQVLLNLLQNAQQAIEQSGKGGLIGVRTASAGEGRVRMEIWDDGPGIPGAIQSRIFDPFFTTKPPGVGTGLGLAIVLGFVRQHGGTVTAQSAPRGGTRFIVELPALRPAQPQPALEAEVVRLAPRERAGRERRPGEQRPAKVLVVEDEPTVGGLIADVLRDEGMRVDVLRDGHVALARAEYETYDLVICDLRMPGMDGQRFFQSLGQRQNPLQQHVLFVTGDAVAPGTQAFLERHRLPYVAKPFRVEELSRAVHEML